MNSSKLQFKTKSILAFALGMVFALTAAMALMPAEANAAVNWVANPASCPQSDPANFPGQNCAPNNMCGDSSGIAQCYDTASISAPAVNVNSSVLYASALTGGYVINCFTVSDSGSPYCDNNGAAWCNRDASCYGGGNNRLTTCLAGKWAYEGAGAYTCGDCLTTHLDCTGDTKCEVQKNVTTYPTGGNNHYGTTCDAADVRCNTSYYDCDATGVTVGNGCEAYRAGACTGAGGLTGTWSCAVDAGGTCTDGGSNYTCTCVTPKCPFESATLCQYFSADPLLWGKQLGSGELIRMGNTSKEDAFVVNNDGSIRMATTSAPGDTTGLLYNVGGDLYWDGTLIGAGASSSALDFQQVTDLGRITTNWIQFAGGTSTSDLSIMGNLNVSGDVFFVNATGTNLAVAEQFLLGQYAVLPAAGYQAGAMVFSTADSVPYFWDGSSWVAFATGTGAATGDLQAVTDIGNTTTNWIEFAGGTSTGDLYATSRVTIGDNDARATGNLNILSTHDYAHLLLDANGGVDSWGSAYITLNGGSDGGEAGIEFQQNGTTYGILYGTPSQLLLQSRLGADLVLTSYSSADIFVSNANGRVGLNTSSPESRLHVSSLDFAAMPILTLENLLDTVQTFVVNANPEGVITASIGDMAIDGTNGRLYIKETGTGTNTGWVAFATGTGAGAGDLQAVTDLGNITTNWIEFAGGTSTGNFLVNRPSAEAYLTVRSGNSDAYFDLIGNAGATALRMSSNGGSDYATFEIASNGSFNMVAGGTNTIWADATNGNVGIGTNTTLSRLHVFSEAASTTAIVTHENNAGDYQQFLVTSNPQGLVTGSRGDLAIDSSNGRLYIKETGNGTNTGWVAFATGTVAGGGTLDDAYNFGGAAAGRQIFTVDGANPVEIINPGLEQWETGLALSNGVFGGGLAFRTQNAFGDRGARIYFTTDTSDPENGTGSYMDWNEQASAFEFGYQTAGTRNSSFYIDYNQMALNVPGTPSNGALGILAGNYNVPVLRLAVPGPALSNQIHMSVGTSTPEAKVTAESGSLFFRTDGVGSSQQLYVKTTDAGNTGWFPLAGAGVANSIWDADSDTGIQVEESADEDIIRFDVAGYEAMRIDPTLGEPLVSINSTLGGYAKILQNINDEYDHFEIRAADVLNAFGGDLVFNFNPEEGFALYYASNQSSMNIGRQSFGVSVNNNLDAIKVDQNAFVGLSTSSPMYRLDVVGDARVSEQLMLGQYALNPLVGLQAGAMVYNTASSTPFFWDGTEWIAFATGTGAAAGDLQAVTDLGNITTNWIEFAGGTSTGTIIPGANNTYALGSSARRWSDIWGANVHIGTSTWDLAQAANGALTVTRAGGSEAMRILTNGNVGIGTELPGTYRLNVAGNAYFSVGEDTSVFEVYNSPKANSHIRVDGDSNYVVLQENSGFVGIGTSAPTDFLHVQGNSDSRIARFSNSLVADGFGFGADLYGGEAGLYEFRGQRLLVGHPIGDANVLMLGQDIAYADQNSKLFSIGTSTFSHQLLVRGSDTGGNNLFRVEGGLNGGYINLYVNGVDDRNSVFEWQRNLDFNSNSQNVMTLANQGYVGIGVQTPAAGLDVRRGTEDGYPGVLFQQTIKASSDDQILAGLRIDPTFNDGGFSNIGEYGLHVVYNSVGGTSIDRRMALLVLENNSHAGMTIRSGINSAGGVRFADPDNNDVGGIMYSHSNDSMLLSTNDDNRLIIDNSGNVGIVNMSPAYKLDITGDARLTAQFMLGQYALNPASGLQAGAMIYNTASSTPFYWNGTAWKALASQDLITLDRAYDAGGSGVGRQIRVDSGAVWLTDAGNGTALQVDYSGSGEAVAVTNGSTGRGFVVAQNGTGVGMYIRQSNGTGLVVENNTGNYGIYVDANSTGDAMRLNNYGSGANALYIDNSADGYGINIDHFSGVAGMAIRNDSSSGGNLIDLTNQSSGAGVLIANSGAGYGIQIPQTGSGQGMYIRQNAGIGIQLDNNTINHGLSIDNNSSGEGLYIDNSGGGNAISLMNRNNTGNGIRIDQDIDGSGIYIDDTAGKSSIYVSKSMGGGDLVYLTNSGTGDSLEIAHASSGKAIRLSNTGTGDSLYITDEASDSTPFVLTSKGDLGIGTDQPDGRLHILADNSSQSPTLLKFQSLNDPDIQSQIYFSVGGNATNWNVNSSGNGGALSILDGTTEVAKFMINGVVINDGSTASIDFRVESDTNTHALFVDATNGNVGFDQTTPLAKLHVGGTTAGSAADYDYLRLEGSGDVDHRVYLPTGSNLMIWDYNATGNGGAIEFRDYTTRVGMFTNSGLVINEGGVTGVGLRVEGDTIANLLYTDAANDRVGIGTNAPAARFHATQSGNTVAVFDRTTSDGTIISLRQAGVEEGTISVSGVTVSYNAFTGSHYAWTDEQIERGMLVSLTGDNRNLHNNPQSEIVYGVTKTTVANDSKVMGAYLALQESNRAFDESNPHLIMAVGNGEMWVADKGENINIGDYLISSDVAGHAQKDAGEFIVSHIIAKAAESIDWSSVTTEIDGVKHKKISVFFESFDKSNMQSSVAGTSLQGGDTNLEVVDLAVGNAVFEGNITVMEHVVLSRDAVGQAMILTGEKKVSVTFEMPYDQLPIVTVTPYGAKRMDYGVENVSLTGFDIVIDPIQYRDAVFNWHAFGNREAKVFVSNGTTLEIEMTDMGTSQLETQINANGTTSVPAPVEEMAEIVPAEPETVAEPSPAEEPLVEEANNQPLPGSEVQTSTEPEQITEEEPVATQEIISEPEQNTEI